MNRKHSNNRNSERQALVQKIAAYDTEILSATRERDELQEKLDESREASSRQNQRELASLEAQLRLLTTYPVALHAGEDRNRREGAEIRPLTTLEQQLYRHLEVSKRLVISVFICFVVGLLCLLIRQSGITIIAMIGMGILFFLLKRRQKAFGKKKQQYVREQIVREWTNERSSLERSIQQKSQNPLNDLPEQRMYVQHIQTLNIHLQRWHLELSLAWADLNALRS